MFSLTMTRAFALPQMSWQGLAILLLFTLFAVCTCCD